MNKADFIDKMHSYNAQETNKSQTARALDAFIRAMIEALDEDGIVTFTGFGSFKVAERPARIGRNPRTGLPVQVAARKAVKFSPGKDLKEAINA